MTAPRRTRAVAVLAGLLAAALTGLAGAAPASAAGGGERVRSDDVVLRLSADGALAVTETIAYDFGDADRHGIERTIPVGGAWDRGHERLTPLSGVRASSPTGAPHAVRVSTEEGVATVRVGDPDRTVHGRQTYVLRYRLGSAAGVPGHPDRLVTDVLGAAWRVPVDAVSARLTGPATPVAARCAAGASAAPQCARCGWTPTAPSWPRPPPSATAAG